jgi:peroxiredoxin
MPALWLSLILLAPAAGDAPPPVPAVRIEDFELPDADGAWHRLSDRRDEQAVVVVFLGVECPLSRLYAGRLAELARAFGPRGVGFVAIDANQHDSAAAVADFARQLPFPLLRDPDNVVADRFEATRITETFVLDEQRVVRYHGRIDDQYTVSVHRPQPQRRDLAVALEELLAGKPVSQPETTVSGCCIDRVRRALPQGSITYCRHIAPILQQHCLVCHRPGQIAPFALTSYKEAAGWAETIAEVVREQRMPPWHADPRHGKFANDPRLSDEEKQLVADWVAGGAPRGNPADLPPPPAELATEWNIGKPDLVVTMREPFRVPAEGVLEYQFFEVDPGFREDKWLSGVEVRPGNRAVVHHCNVFFKPPGRRELVARGELGSFYVAGWTPGTPPMLFPEGMAKLVPAGWKFVFVVHYVTTGTVQTDQTSLGIVFADPKTVKKEVATNLLLDEEMSIPPHTADHRVEHERRMERDVLLLSMFPHMHLRGKSFRYEATYPDGTTEVLLDVPRYDFNWQNRYVLAEPKLLPAGTVLRCIAHYDNSAANPANPDPGATVHIGPQSTDEMFNGYYELVLADQDLTRPLGEWARLAAGRAAVLAWPALAAVLCGGTFLVWRRLGRNR